MSELILSPEFRFLLMSSHRDNLVQRQSLLQQLLESGLNQEILLSEIEKNRVYPIVLFNLKRIGLDKVPILKPVGELTQNYSRMSMALVQESARIMNTLEQNNIQAIFLKGPILAQLIYGNVSLRASRDIDVLVRREDFEKAFILLESIGYQDQLHLSTPKRRAYFFAHPHIHHIEMKMDGIICELHWKPSSNNPCTFTDLYKNSTTIDFFRTTFVVPGMIPYLCYLMNHGAFHGYYRLRWLMDIYELIISKDCPNLTELYEFFDSKNIKFILYFTFLYMEAMELIQIDKKNAIENSISLELQEAENSKPVLTIAETDHAEWLIAQDLLKEAINLRMTSKENEKKSIAMYTYLYEDILSSRGIGDYLSFKERFQITTTEFKLFNIPDSLFFLYYILRPIGWIWRHFSISGHKNMTRSIRSLFHRAGIIKNS